MAKHQKNRPSRKPAPRSPQKPARIREPMAAWKKNLIFALITAVLAAIPFAYGKYFELNTPGAFDSGAYVYSAAHVLDGAEIGVDEKPSAQHGTLLVNMLGVKLFGYSDYGPKIIQGLMQIAALVLMYLAMRKAFGALAAGVGVVMASLFLSSPLIAKYGNVKEQYMIAFMIAGISCFMLYEFSKKWPWAVAAGACLIWGPLFKQTGMSAIGAVGVYLFVQPIFKNRTVKQTAKEIGLLFAGAAAALAPIFIWIIGWDIQWHLPYEWLWNILAGLIPSGDSAESGAIGGAYISEARKFVPFSEQFPRVMRYYGLFWLPIGLAAGSIVFAVAMFIQDRFFKDKRTAPLCRRLVLLLGLWWMLDMAFVWISPRSYEQYYLPLNASAAMLAGFVLVLFTRKMLDPTTKIGWKIIGLVIMHVVFITGTHHIIHGVKKSPFSGQSYGKDVRRNGYVQRYKEVSRINETGIIYPWQAVGQYIQNNSEPDDKMYVWGWYPGIYVAAQRFSSASKAFSMPRPAPPVLAELVDTLLKEFKAEPPKYIVDSHKRHIPLERPPYELWPIMNPRFFPKLIERPVFLPRAPAIIEQYNQAWAQMLEKSFDQAEAERYKALAPLREYIRDNYEIVDQQAYRPDPYGGLRHPKFSNQVIFRLKNRAG